MPETVRAKFRCTRVAQIVDDYGKRTEVQLAPVYQGSDASSENSRFWKNTPNGECKMTITNPDASTLFVANQEYYLDFTMAAVTPA